MRREETPTHTDFSPTYRRVAKPAGQASKQKSCLRSSLEPAPSFRTLTKLLTFGPRIPMTTISSHSPPSPDPSSFQAIQICSAYPVRFLCAPPSSFSP